MSDSQKSDGKNGKTMDNEEEAKEVAYKMLESDGNIYNFTLSGISVNSQIS